MIIGGSSKGVCPVDVSRSQSLPPSFLTALLAERQTDRCRKGCVWLWMCENVVEGVKVI